MSALAGKRVVVIGASSGIGRGVAVQARKAGAEVIAAARRVERLDEVVAEAPGVTTLTIDLRDAESRDAFCAAVRDRFGGIDVLFVSAGAAPLRSYQSTDDDDWLHALETNLIGIHRTVAGLIDLVTDESLTVVVSSETAQDPRSHMGAYGASKAALEHSIEQWREEHPWLRFSVVNLGATIPTEFGTNFGHDELLEAFEAWGQSGRQQSKFLSTPEVCDFLIDTISSLMAAPSIDMRSIVLRSPSPPATDLAANFEAARQGREALEQSDG